MDSNNTTTTGKRQRRWLINNVSATGPLIHLFDKISKLNFLVDTGAQRSILPHQSTAPPTGPILNTADNTTIPAWGTRDLQLHIGSQHFKFNFVLAKVSYPILGADFLSHFHLIVDVHRRQVISSKTLIPLISSCFHPTPSPLIAQLHSVPSEVRHCFSYCFFNHHQQSSSSTWSTTSHLHIWTSNFCLCPSSST